MTLVMLMDDYGADYPARFLDEAGDLRAATAASLAVRAAGVADGSFSMRCLGEVFPEWHGVTVAFMDGYRLDNLNDLWFEGGASAELGEEAEWPGPALRAFFDALVGELARYLAWRRAGAPGLFGPGVAVG